MTDSYNIVVSLNTPWLSKKALQTEVKFHQGRSVEQLCQELSMTEQTYYRWRREYGGMKIAQACRLKDLDKGNTRLKKGGGGPDHG